MTTWDRRTILRAALAGGGLAACPWSGSFAQSGSAALVRAPKHALVIGNSKYKQAPLRNPGNDATGMGEALKSAGFSVTLGLDLSQAEMREAIRSYSESLIKAKAVGLFYFAGHGVQLAWRNYLIPVDADIANIDELRQRTVDVNSLIEGIRKAANPMNLIILDACRDNPFGSRARVEQKGLSQLDAPPGTLLAYATAPGNTATDGEGQNGLYTENLLREIRVPEARVEDVFKRVRLAVRLRSNGQQIPWESTSLEEDFWFIPPKVLKKLAEEEAEREFKQEQALWESSRAAAKPEPLEDYLRRYPSGRFTELAQVQLDRLLAKRGEKKIEVVSAPKNPYTKGTVRTDTAYKVGDRYSYRLFDTLTKLEKKPFTTRVTQITEDQVIFNGGGFITDLLGNRLKGGSGGTTWSANQTVPTEFTVGKRWRTRFNSETPNVASTVVDLELVVADREEITVPAGTFNAFRIEARGFSQGTRSSAIPSARGSIVNVQWNWKTWYAPDQVRRPIAVEWGKSVYERQELTSFRQV